MSDVLPRVPIIGIKRRAVYAIRDFPKGCGIKVISNPNPPPPIQSASIANYVNDAATSKSKEEIRVSNPNDTEIRQVGHAKNEIFDASEGVKINGKVVAEEKSVNGNVALEEQLRDFKRRKVWAVRDFPVGCGRGASNVEKGHVPLSESMAVDDGTEVGIIASSKSKAFNEAIRNGESFEKAEDEGLVGVTVQETKGEAAVKALKVTGLSWDEKKKHAKKLDDVVKRNDSNRSQAEVKEASGEAKVLSPEAKSMDVETNQEVQQEEAVEGSERGSSEVKKNDSKEIEQNAQESSGEDRANPLSKNSCSENIAEDRSASEKQLEGCDVKQTDNNHQDEELQEMRVPLEIKIADKVGQSTTGKSVDKGSISIPKDVKKNIKKGKLADDEGNESLEAYGDRLIVHALMSAENCPWRKGKKSGGIVCRSYTPKTKTKKVTKFSGSNSASLHKDIADAEDDQDSLPQDGGNEKVLVTQNSPYVLCVAMTPSAPSRPISKGSISNEELVNRNMVKKALRLFQLIIRKLLQGEEKSKGKEEKAKENGKKRADLDAARILKDNNEWVNYGKPIVGHVPGVEVGDEFHYRVELSIIGIHRPFQGGIDYTKKNGMILATSIVASGGYPDDVDNSDVLIYSGSGGNASGSGDKQPGDQKLERGNLALKNSIDAQTPVRVVYGSKELCKSDSRDTKPKMVSTFTYDGLYIVEKYWPESGTNNFIVFKFQLRRMLGQPETALKEIKKAKKSKVREGLCVKDISDGKESIPICAVNTIDNELPMPFKYINKVIYLSSYAKMAPKGCDCMDGCSNSEKCACAIKNGGEIPYNFNGAIVQAKVLVYECGPLCKCPPSCHNRVSQHGIKLPLEIFKTSTRGWGVRSLYSIPSGTFVCEYVGEMLQDVEAEQRINDEYLFDIGHNYEDHTLWDGLPSFVPGVQSDAVHETVEDVGFTIDAAECGNVGRFINHSCSPNLYAQNVLYDHDEKKMPHVMFFAIDNIPPLQELNYHYNYTLDQVRDSEGNIKKKECFCGSPECTGRLY